MRFGLSRWQNARRRTMSSAKHTTPHPFHDGTGRAQDRVIPSSRRLLTGAFTVGLAVAVAGVGMPGLASAAVPVQLKATSYSACNGGDDTAGLKKALGALRAGDTLIIPAGVTCRHSTVLKIGTAGVRVTGPGTLLATDESQAGLWINANNVTVDGGLVLRVHATQRWTTPNQALLSIQKGMSGSVIRNVTSDGSGAAGVIILGAVNFTLDRVTVLNSRADGIHMTAGAHHGTITNAVVRGAGDDGISVVSYKSTAVPCHDIVVDSPHVYNNSFARGMTVIGGYNITYSNVYVEGSPSAAVLISANTAWNTHPSHDVKVLTATFVNANTDSGVAHGALVVAANTVEGISNVAFKNITIKNTRVGAPADVQILTFSGSPITNVSMDHVSITGGPAKDFKTTVTNHYSLTNWVVNGKAVPDRIKP